jgi:fused signal recognition particle receptor
VAAEAGDENKNLDEEQLLAVRQTLDDAIGAVKATHVSDAGDESEELITMELTKSEFVTSVQEILKADRKERKAEKAEQAKLAAEEAEKNANNDGEVTEAEVKATSEHDADDVNAVKSETEVVETPETDVVKQVADQLEELSKKLGTVEETVAKIAKRPRSGGPSLDGQSRGVTPAGEGRQSDVTKSAADVDTEDLEKSLAAETDPQRKAELGLRLTRERLTKMHETGQI